jgi:hypothetical protein
MTIWIVSKPNVCNFLLVLEVQILDTAFSSGVENVNQKRSAFSQIPGFAFRSTPLFHRHFIIHPVLFILCFFSVRISCHSSSQLYLSLLNPLNHWPIYVWAMSSVSWVIYFSSSRSGWRSLLCYLLYFGLIRVSCVILTFILSSVTCKHDTAMYCGNYEMFISHVIFILLWYYLMHVKLQLRECLQVKKL